jgi:hypothetical protein
MTCSAYTWETYDVILPNPTLFTCDLEGGHEGRHEGHVEHGGFGTITVRWASPEIELEN